MKELLYQLVGGKVWLPALLVVGGVIFVLKRLIVSSVEKNTALDIIKRIERDPGYSRTVAEQLDIPYGVMERFLPEHYEKLKEYVRTRAMIGNYQILYAMDVSSSELLIFALISFDDFDVGITGNGTDVRKNSYLKFLIRHDRDAQRLTVYSDTYATSTEKFQRDGFLSAILRDSNS